jgi:hypothetical protein
MLGRLQGIPPWAVIWLAIATGAAAQPLAPRAPSSAAVASQEERRLGTVAMVYSRDRAEEVLERLRREGREGRLRIEAEDRWVQRLAIGYFTTRSQADDLRRHLRGHQISGDVLFEPPRGFVVVLGHFATEDRLATARETLTAIGQRHHLVEPVRVAVRVYYVDELALLGARIGRAHEQLAAGLEEPRRDKAAAATPRAPTPTPSPSEPRREAQPPEALRAGFFALRADAEAIAHDLAQIGLQTWVTQVVGVGYAVGVHYPGARLRPATLQRYLEAHGHRQATIHRVSPGPGSWPAPPGDPGAVPHPAPEEPAGEALARRDPAGDPPPPTAAASPQVFSFGPTRDEGPFLPEGFALRDPAPFEARLSRFRLETRALPWGDGPVDGEVFFDSRLVAAWKPGPRWEAQASARLEALHQSGVEPFSELGVDYGETFLRWRGERLRWTLGAQTVLWGRVSAQPPSDRLSTLDLSRLLPIDLAEQRRAVPAVRLEWLRGGWKADLLWLPWFRPAELPPQESPWFPIDRGRGEILGVPPSPLLTELVQGAEFRDLDGGRGGGGVRISRIGPGFDFGVTLLEGRQSMPYLRLDDGVRRALLAGFDPAEALEQATGPALLGVHPRGRLAAADLAFEAGGLIWRLEGAYLTALPATTPDWRVVEVPGAEWALEAEALLGSAGRLNVVLSGRHLLRAPGIIDEADTYRLTGLLEVAFSRQRWRAQTAFSLGLAGSDVYLRPQVAFLGWEPFEIYLGAHLFSGDPGTLGGFHRDRDHLELGWRMRH